jgi:hypothetical protein
MRYVRRQPSLSLEWALPASAILSLPTGPARLRRQVGAAHRDVALPNPLCAGFAIRLHNPLRCTLRCATHGAPDLRRGS